MWKRFGWLAGTLGFMLLAPAASAQQAQAPAPTYYVSITYVKALPGQGAAYRTWMTTTSKKFYQELMSAEPSFVHWDCAQNMYRGLDQQDFDYACATVTRDGPLDPARDMEPIYKKLGTTTAEYQGKLASMRTVVGSELLRRLSGTSTTSTGTTVEGNFRVTTQLKVNPGMMDEFTTRATTLTLPVMQANLATAAGLKSWSMWTRLFPNGAATDYDVLAVTSHGTLSSAVGGGSNPNAAAEAFIKVHPDKNYATYSSNAREYATAQRRGISRVIAVVERDAAVKTSENR